MVLKPEHAAAQAVAPLPPAPDPHHDDPPRGFKEFYRSALRPLVRAAMAYGATPEEAEDAAMEALERMIPKWPIEPDPLAYARITTLRCFFKARQRGELRTARRLIERGHVPLREGAEDERLTEIEGREWLEDVLGRLTPAQREVLEHVADGLKFQQIASVLGVSTDVIRQRVHTARQRLTAILHPDGTYRQVGSNQAHPSREEAR